MFCSICPGSLRDSDDELAALCQEWLLVKDKLVVKKASRKPFAECLNTDYIYKILNSMTNIRSFF